MAIHRESASRVSLLVLLPVLIAAGIAGPAAGQCPWEGAPGCVPFGSPPFTMCDRNMASNRNCQAPVNNGAGTICNPSVADTDAIGLSVIQTNTVATVRSAAFCSWQCTTTSTPPTMVTCRIQLLDGLPIELMDFSVEDDQPAEGKDREGGAEDEEGPAGE